MKRLIGRKFSDEVVGRDKEMVPYEIVKADNGDAWVEANDKKMAPPEISARVLMKMKKTAEDYLARQFLRLSLQFQPTSMILKGKPLKTLGKSLDLMLKGLLTNQQPPLWLTVWNIIKEKQRLSFMT